MTCNWELYMGTLFLLAEAAYSTSVRAMQNSFNLKSRIVLQIHCASETDNQG
jgi:hypothetical protein